MTTLEALLGSDQEITFKVAFRTASLLGSSEEEKARLLTRFKQYYGTRSAISMAWSAKQNISGTFRISISCGTGRDELYWHSSS